MSILLVATKRYEGQRLTSCLRKPATQTNRDPNRDIIFFRSNQPRTSETYRRHNDVLEYELQFLLSGVLPVYFKTRFTSYREDCLMCCPSEKAIKSDTRSCLQIALGGLHEHKLCDTLQVTAPLMPKRLIKRPYSISRANSIDSDCCRLPMVSVLSTKADISRSNQF